MATPTADTYSVASGASVYGGRYGPAVVSLSLGTDAAVFAGSASRGPAAASVSAVTDGAAFSGSAVAPPPALAALMGDSLTDQGYGVTPWYWQNGVAGGVLKTIHNAGVSSETVANMLARVNNSYTHATLPGMAGLPALGWIPLRAGTNDARSGAISGGIQTSYASLIAALKTYLASGGKILVFPVPPLGGASAAANANVPGYNNFLQSLVAADSSLVWIDDCTDVKDGGGAQIGSFFTDGIHMNGAGTMQMGITGGTALASVLAPYGYASPLSADVADVYPAQPQWNPNHVNSGGVASTGAFTGTAPTGYTVTNGGAGVVGTVSIVAADGGDTNATPWMRITPTQAQSGSSVAITRALSGRTITTSDPSALDVIVQIRFNGFDTRQWTGVRLWSQGSTGAKINQEVTAPMGGSADLTRTVTLRHALPRKTANAEASLTLYAFVTAATTLTAAMGSIDFRCITLRG